VRRLAHRFGAAGEYGIGIAQENELGALRDSLEPRAAQPVDCDCRYFDRQAGLEPDVPGEVDRVGGGLERVAEHHVADVGGRDAGRSRAARAA